MRQRELDRQTDRNGESVKERERGGRERKVEREGDRERRKAETNGRPRKCSDWYEEKKWLQADGHGWDRKSSGWGRFASVKVFNFSLTPDLIRFTTQVSSKLR